MTILYTLFIVPLELIFEYVFENAYQLTGSYGLSIIVLSVVVNLLALPLYSIADRIQRKEKEIQRKLRFWEDHIKKHFSGDERFMMLRTYYRQMGYKPYYMLRSAMPLMLQIPFFIAAYRFLSGRSDLSGVSFLCINDLGCPDGMLTLGAVSINLLPLLMTVINIISAYIYSESLNDGVQMYAIALVFLVLLYRSPSGLVFYWVLNQIFSLVKNLISKYSGTKRNSIKSTDISDRLLSALTLEKKDLFPVFVFGFTICFFATGEIYLSNAEEFWFTYGDMWSVFIELFLILFLSIILILRKKTIKPVINSLLLGLTFALFLQGQLLPYDYGQLNGEVIYWSRFGLRPVINTLIWILVIAATIYLARVFGEKAFSVMRKIAGVIILIEVISLLFSVSRNRDLHKKNVNGYISTEGEFEISSGRNTLILLLDAFDSEIMQELIRNYPDEVTETFEDFTYYHNTLGSSGNTLNSVPIFLTGFVNERSLPFSDYMEEAYDKSPLICELSEPGYDAGFYLTSRLVMPSIQKAADNYRIQKIKVVGQLGIGLKFLQLTAFKYSPHILKKYFWLYTGEFNDLKMVENSDLYNTSNFTFYDNLCSKGFSTPSTQDCFRYYHINGTHVPLDMNEKCELVDEAGNDVKTQARGCLLIVRRFVEELKKKGVYDNSVIIVMADHGYGHQMHQNPLFMVKQRHATMDFTQSEAALSFIDLPDMLCEFLKSDTIDISKYERTTRRFYAATEIKGTTTLVEYETGGKAYDETSMKETGRVFSWKYR